ncbi:MAG: c-type cytochrome [Gammaproteobacteria bacterium]|nr:c-type cytochrome [Gammaproteobacteria bacterium]MDH3467566.1 c-type cytochrome [Gammaproteobacteria bacterium]
MTDKQFFRSFFGLIGGLVTLTVALVALATFVTTGINDKMGDSKQMERDQAIAERVAPVGSITIGDAATVMVSEANAAESGVDGKTTYETACIACHGAGVAGAPKFGDLSAWKDRIAQGNDALYERAIEGFQGSAGFMPAKGGNAALSDDDVKAAVDHMVQGSSE